MAQWRFDIMKSLKHGGNLDDFIQKESEDHKTRQWLDISSGVNPCSYNMVDEDYVSCMLKNAGLPQKKDIEGLYDVARHYYLKENRGYEICVANGTQQFIQLLPFLFLPNQKIGIVSPCYGEYERAIQCAGHHVLRYVYPLKELPKDCDHVFVNNPINPMAQYYEPCILVEWAEELHRRQGYLIVDEAYIDTCQEMSLLSFLAMDNVLILRSVGKFFGLPGLRLGFLFGSTEVIKRMEMLLGPWAVNTPTLYIGKHILSDTKWQTNTRIWLKQQSLKQYHMIGDIFGYDNFYACDFFQTLFYDNVFDLASYLKKHAIYVRIFEEYPQIIRFGLCRNHQEYEYLQKVLMQWNI